MRQVDDILSPVPLIVLGTMTEDHILIGFSLVLTSCISRNSCLSICELWITRISYAAFRKRNL